jgi:penicillin-insensitive murein endopeptidase
MTRANRRLRVALLGAVLACSLGVTASAKTTTEARKKPAPAAQAPRREPAPRRIEALGSISVGRPDAGFLVNGVRLPASPDWVINSPSKVYGTEETIAQLSRCVRRVRARFPGSPAVTVGSISKQGGGFLAPHKSHRSGRDADVYFFRRPGARWYEAATRSDIDLPRTWALLRCFVSETDVDFVLIDRRIQPWLEQYAIGRGEPREWVKSLFQDGPGAQRAVVRHAPGHVAHMHVRFVSPGSRQRAITYYDRLVAEGRIKGVYATKHAVKRGETLGSVAKKYKISVAQLLKLNRLGSTMIRVGQVLIVSPAAPIKGLKDPIRIPPRRVPPKSMILSRVAPDDAPGQQTSPSSSVASGRRDLLRRRGVL